MISLCQTPPYPKPIASSRTAGITYYIVHTKMKKNKKQQRSKRCSQVKRTSAGR